MTLLTSIRLFLTTLCFIFTMITFGQERQFNLENAEALFKKTQNDVLSNLAKKGYSFKGQVGNILSYKKSNSTGQYSLSVLFANNKLKSILWTEHIIYANQIAVEVQTGEYSKDEQADIFGTDILNNADKGLKILITPHSSTNEINLNMQLLPVAKLDPNKPKAKMGSRASTKIQSSFFSGTKKFCDGLDTWYYLVTINGNKITIQSFPDEKNDYYKNKTKAVETMVGEIKGDKIVTKDPPEYLTNRFKYENGVLYEVNNEGGYNDYAECTTKYLL